MIRLKTIFIACCLTALVSCASTPDELEALEKTLKLYEHTLRWERLEKAVAFQKDPEPVTNYKQVKFKNIQVTGYKVMTASNSGLYNAVQRVEIRYYNRATGIERTISDSQKWEFDKKKERWYLLSRLPEFK